SKDRLVFCSCSHILSLEEVGDSNAEDNDHCAQYNPREQKMSHSTRNRFVGVKRGEERPLEREAINAKLVTVQADRRSHSRHCPACCEESPKDLQGYAVEGKEDARKDH